MNQKLIALLPLIVAVLLFAQFARPPQPATALYDWTLAQSNWMDCQGYSRNVLTYWSVSQLPTQSFYAQWTASQVTEVGSQPFCLSAGLNYVQFEFHVPNEGNAFFFYDEAPASGNGQFNMWVCYGYNCYPWYLNLYDQVRLCTFAGYFWGWIWTSPETYCGVVTLNP